MGSCGTSGSSATRPAAATTTGRAHPGAWPGGPSPRPGKPGSPDTGLSPGPVAPGGGNGAGPGPLVVAGAAARPRGTAAGPGERAGLGGPWPTAAPARCHPYARARSSPTATMTAAASWTYSDSLAGSRFCTIGRWVNTANGSGTPTALPDTVSLEP